MADRPSTKAERFMALAAYLRGLPPAQLAVIIEDGKRVVGSPHVRRFFEVLEAELQAAGKLPPDGEERPPNG